MMQHLSKWQDFVEHCKAVREYTLLELFQHRLDRVDQLTLEAAGIHIDFSKNHITADTLKVFAKLCKEAKFSQSISSMLSGEKINETEQRAVLHTALRARDDRKVMVDDVDVMPEIRAVQHKMLQFVEAVYQKQWKGYTGKAITDVVNIGIGGSDLGPRMVVDALKPYAQDRVNVHFIANVDGADMTQVLANLNPERTLFIIASKSFTTQETLLNAKTARFWLLSKMKKVECLNHHCVAITSAVERAVKFGINADNCFALWDFVGGRYSLWSAVGLPIMFAIGSKHYAQLLEGAFQMDEHFRSAPIEQNLPFILAMVGVIYNNIWDLDTHAIIPYANDLQWLPNYLQQADMESNGKSVSMKGVPIRYATAPIIWGGVGTNGQHAFHQLLYQGTVTVPVDFILPLRSHYDAEDHQVTLVANCLAQAQAMMEGRSYDQAMHANAGYGLNELTLLKLVPHQVVMGNKPSTMIYMEALTPETLGALIALYEHKIFVQSLVWNINAFDQWGVELGKQLSKPILEALQNADADIEHIDASTLSLMEAYQRAKF